LIRKQLRIKASSARAPRGTHRATTLGLEGARAVTLI
jgi:hypothetical protein